VVVGCAPASASVLLGRSSCISLDTPETGVAVRVCGLPQPLIGFLAGTKKSGSRNTGGGGMILCCLSLIDALKSREMFTFAVSGT